MSNAAKMTLLCVGFVFVSGAFAADDLFIIRKQAVKGSFQGLERDLFILLDENGRRMEESRSTVMSIDCEPACPVSIVMTGKKKPVQCSLKSYSKMKYTIVEGGKERTLLAGSVKEIKANRPMSMAATRPSGAGAGMAPPPRVDIRALAAQPNLTDAQKKALHAYSQAQNAYDQFLTDSSAMVAQMNSVTGKKREALLNDLRSRKDAEQPVKNALLKAIEDLKAAFPAQ